MEINCYQFLLLFCLETEPHCVTMAGLGTHNVARAGFCPLIPWIIVVSLPLWLALFFFCWWPCQNAEEELGICGFWASNPSVTRRIFTIEVCDVLFNMYHLYSKTNDIFNGVVWTQEEVVQSYMNNLNFP